MWEFVNKVSVFSLLIRVIIKTLERTLLFYYLIFFSWQSFSCCVVFWLLYIHLKEEIKANWFTNFRFQHLMSWYIISVRLAVWLGILRDKYIGREGSMLLLYRAAGGSAHISGNVCERGMNMFKGWTWEWWWRGVGDDWLTR